MTDVFFCGLHDRPYLRRYMGYLCRERWEAEEGVRLRPRVGYGQEFQHERRKIAEIDSRSDIYVVADDDCFPQAEPFLAEGVRILEEHPEFAILSMMPSNAKINPWRPPGREYEIPSRSIVESISDGPFTVDGVYELRAVYEDDDVMEHVSVGGIRFCRRGCLEEWPPFTGPGYDREQADALRAAGYRVGYFKHLKMNHLGEGYSTVWSKA